MTVFKNCTVVLDVKNVPFKEKNELRLALLENGGNISYVINKECSFVVTSSVNDLSSNRQRSIQKLQIPVVGTQYVWSCLDQGHLLPLTEHNLNPQLPYPTSEFLPPSEVKVSTRILGKETFRGHPELPKTEAEILEKGGPRPGRFRVYKEGDHDLPEFPSYFQVAKYSVFERVKPKTLSVLELQSAKGRAGQQYRVLCSVLHEAETAVVQDKLVFCVTSEDAVEAYLQLMNEMETEEFTKTHTLPPEVERLASYSLQQLLLEEKLNCSTLSQEVGVFVELVWTEALGSLNNILTVPVSRISLNDVSRVEGLLLQAQKTEKEDEVKALLEEVNTLLPLRMIDPPSKDKLVSQKLDLCQLIRDIINVSEATLGSPSPSSLGKYRALRCSIEVVPPQNPEFHVVSQLLQDRPVQIQQILRVSRGMELQLFKEDLGNIKPLLHSTSPSSFVGILSRGLLLPRVGVEQHGIERTDIGNLGGGIYFSDSLKTSVKYSKPSVTDGSRLLLVCEVALGRCKDLLKKDTTLTCAPDGYHSVHGVQRTPNRLSEFEDDEFVVYNTEQIRLKYVVQYSLEGDKLKEFQPQINTQLTQLTDTTPDTLSSDDSEGLESTKNPLEEMNAGLLDSSGQKLPLHAVNVRCKLMDLLCQVIIFQTYTNQSAVPIEAKYVFPLEETAAVCGFEAFINGKHVIGKVKEKEQARKEYKQAIEKGHGAYLMDQDAPDVFTISVGNLPPGATVLIKVTFITELVVRSGSIVFLLSGSVAPWQQRATLNQTTQATVEKIGVTELQSEGEFSLSMSIEMPYEIINLSSSHRIKTKRTDCKAVISTLPGQTLRSEGLQVSFSLSNIHMPRMWVENHPDKDSQACMLVFYPDFKSSGVSSSGGPSSVSDVVILLDSSKSMQGDNMLNARRIALQVLKSLDRSLKINIISFSTDYKEAFPAPVPLDEASESARKFIMSCCGSGGSTDLWRPLWSLSLLPPCRGVRNILLLSDGHVHNQPLTLQLVRENSCHTRLFTCGLSLTANRHMLRALAQAGGGTYEFFDTKIKHTWAEKVRAQVERMESPGCRSVAVKWQQFNPTVPLPVQAPSQLHALFSDCHTLVYGFVPHCTQATLFGDLSGQEIKTMVSTTELQKTKGTFLHKLTARAIIRDYEDGILANSEAEHEGKKAELKSYIIELSKEFSILSQFTSFVAIEEREQNELDTGFTDIPKIISEEDVNILPYMGWTEEKLKSAHISSAEDDDTESEGWRSSSTSEDLLGSACVAADFDDDLEDEYENKFRKKTSAAHSFPHPSSSSSWHPSRFEGSTNAFRGYLKKLSAPRPEATRRYEIPVEVLCKASRLPPPSYCGASMSDRLPPPAASQVTACMPPPPPPPHPRGGASMSDRLPPPAASQVTTCMPPPPSVESLSNIRRILPPSADAMMSRTGLLIKRRPAPLPPPLSSYEPPSSDLLSFESVDFIEDGLDSLTKMSPIFCPMSPVVSSATEFATELYASTPPVCADPPHPPRLASQQFMSMTPSPAPPPAISRRVEKQSFFERSRAGGSIAFAPPAVSAPPSPAASGGFGGSFRSKNKRFGFGSSAPGAQRKERKQLLLQKVEKPISRRDTVAWNELFELQHEDGYWECTDRLSSFLNLDVDFFANVFLQEKGICSLGVKAHAEILRLMATLLVLQLIRVKKLEVGQLLESLLRLKESQEPRYQHTSSCGVVIDSCVFVYMTICSSPFRPMYWEAVKRAMDWACRTDRQYPCVCSRLEIGRDWESSTRQLLGCDSPHPYSPLKPVLERRMDIICHAETFC
ncbi:poly [ADP-ribose] polymerase 4-like isoform X4 [Sinocyclocheilus anshuiensis]|nr:PREDICTED: poly [ADP-ribose] polymerase 4-like isoform X3 [Sinocyclocheilus anshuiensis]XP_016309740.1 PREDICTED: poly [ADP-ribose] polymerase 4-like isoform X3 [Sinocyclocheilus anshuiensis]XP_016309742.1 PREDICTED: poly [ADP-ribose] polymerase 4-like isoform X4 [Sinocyclocheilus anshuiensis]XP_016309743.1 PREDICTED: poly [ADP-ribose] polymerase 4-like isoform X4 [Sinocyclocheilus anshuiensis]